MNHPLIGPVRQFTMMSFSVRSIMSLLFWSSLLNIIMLMPPASDRMAGHIRCNATILDRSLAYAPRSPITTALCHEAHSIPHLTNDGPLNCVSIFPAVPPLCAACRNSERPDCCVVWIA